MFIVEEPHSGCPIGHICQDNNVFVWSLRATCFSCRVDGHYPMTVATLHRWVQTSLIAEFHSNPSEYGIDFTYAIFPVTVNRLSKWGLSHFEICRTSSMSGLDPESSDALPPGHYALYREDGSMPSAYYQFYCDISFSKWELEYLLEQPNIVTESAMSSKLRTMVLDRDNYRCSLTGTVSKGSDLEVVWIVPPYMYFLLIKDGYTKRDLLRRQIYHGHHDYTSLPMVAQNCLTITKDLAQLFWDNEVGIDVDDGYRIVFFQRPKHISLLENQKTHLARFVRADCPADEYLRCHFEQCLAVNTFGSRVRPENDNEGFEYIS